MSEATRRALLPEPPTFEMIGILLALQSDAGVMSEIPETRAQAAAMIGALREDRDRMKEVKDRP